MDFVCLDGSMAIVELKPSKYPPRKISTIQTAARERIKQEFGDQIILEEFPIPKSKMRVDFFLPKINIVVEVLVPSLNPLYALPNEASTFIEPELTSLISEAIIPLYSIPICLINS